jgi:hypothetical protein
LNYKKIVVITSVITIVIIAASSFNLSGILMKLPGHSMEKSDHASTDHSSHDSGTKNSILNKLEINTEPSTKTSANNVENINTPTAQNVNAPTTENISTPPRKKEPNLANVTFISYVVNPADTLWRIAKYYMPNYSVQDTEDTIGIITYIAEKNNLAKGTDGNYMIYYGQKLKIPAQASIVPNVMTASNKKTTVSKNITTANKTVVTEPTKKPSTTTVSNTPKNINSTPTTATTNAPSSNSNTNLPVSQTDHSAHTSH